MTLSKHLFLGIAVISMSACQTVPSANLASPNDILLSDITTSSVGSSAVPTKLSAANPTCLKFYDNTANYMAAVQAAQSAPQGPSSGGLLMRTLILGTLSGVASGGVAAIGIENAFAEAALAGTANQVTYQMGGKAYDSVMKKDPAAPAIPVNQQLANIENAAKLIGCPAPDANALAPVRAAVQP
jgi:hypothetical protein